MNRSNENKLKIAAYSICIIFAIMIIGPLFYMLSNALKDDTALYEAIPRFIPDSAKSVSVVLDYDGIKNTAADEMKNTLLKDATLALYSIPYELNTSSIYEVKVYGIKDGKTIFYSRASKAQMRLELDFGIYMGTSVQKDVLLSGDKYRKSEEILGYRFDPDGISEVYNTERLGKNDLDRTVGELLSTKYETKGRFGGTILSTNNLLMLENFKYYFKLPSYMYKQNDLIKNYSFLIFMGNTIIVIVWAVLIETLLCSLTAYPLSRLFGRKISNGLTIFFLATMMVPFVTILVPQFMMFKSMGFYNNYLALLLPYLYPYPYYTFLYKGFFDQLPGSLFDAARIDGAGELYNYAVICMPLSKPIIALIALSTFLSNWNDFFWAWMVTEKQSLWTLNVALYNIARNEAVKQNFLMGLSIITIIPVILLTMAFSEQIKRSIAFSGIKG